MHLHTRTAWFQMYCGPGAVLQSGSCCSRKLKAVAALTAAQSPTSHLCDPSAPAAGASWNLIG